MLRKTKPAEEEVPAETSKRTPSTRPSMIVYLHKQGLSYTQVECPVCGERLPAVYYGGLAHKGDAHHVLVKRGPKGNMDELYDAHNIVLLHPACHVPPGPDMDYKCCYYLIRTYGSKAIEAWVATLPFKEPLALSDAYYRARQEVEGK